MFNFIYIRDVRLLTNIPRQHFLAQEVLAHLQNLVSTESRHRTLGRPRSGWAILSAGIDNVHHGLILVVVVLWLGHLKYHN